MGLKFFCVLLWFLGWQVCRQQRNATKNSAVPFVVFCLKKFFGALWVIENMTHYASVA